MKSLIILFFLLSISCFGQEPEAAVELTELNIMYRGYENEIAVAVTNNDGAIPSIGCGNCDTIYWTESNHFIIKPGKAKELKLIISLKSADTTIFVKKINYRISNLPDPIVFWGAARSGSKGSQSSRIIMAKYTPEIPLRAWFNTSKWTITINGESMSGEGNSLTDAKELINSAQEGDKVFFVIETTGPDDVLREVTGVFTI